MSKWTFIRRVNAQGARFIWDFSHSSDNGDFWLGFECSGMAFQAWRELEPKDALTEIFVALLPEEEKAAALAAAIEWRVECLGG